MNQPSILSHDGKCADGDFAVRHAKLRQKNQGRNEGFLSYRQQTAIKLSEWKRFHLALLPKDPSRVM
ncbi:hypothetical protein [Paraburkholderia sp. Ac-20347]|uniref:hypothetical protein n=1 Tax=Paraburkholderia sp. Ac-20347 TaxID=2703892 RepID=UPI00197CD067|nr:hypothetical protein [Paraburkholderia sp. Ac-20347]MBN3812344.1 hypothetical protein [Paraburkholderia sp. Ac-20347]